MIAAVHAVLGDTDAAFEWLGRAYEVRDAWLPWLGVDARFDRVRGDPRFLQLLGKIGISETRPSAATIPFRAVNR